MKILHIITRLIVGGAQENTLLTCEGLHARGHEVILLTGPSLGPEGSLMDRARAGGYQVRVTPHLVRNPHPWHDLLARREIYRLCRTLRPDVVHTHSSKAGIVGRSGAWNARPRPRYAASPIVVHTIHGLPFHPYQSRWVNRAWIALERWAARRCDAIVSVADSMTFKALANGIGRKPQFTTIYSGMEVDPFLHQPPDARHRLRQRLNIRPGALVFATIARLQPLKGHDDLLAIAEELFRYAPNAHFLWIGDGVFRSRFTRLINERGWANRFTLTGLVPPEEVPALLPAADVIVHPSYREGLARALPQGALAGLPLISYDCDGADEVCIDHKTGLLVATGDQPGLRSALLWMAQHPDEREAMGFAGQTLCLKRFPASAMVDQLEALYQRLAQERS